ncbi:MAG: PQQ-dependent dehydrogenase, methanol/ethanol family [Bacteroidota bacterium]
MARTSHAARPAPTRTPSRSTPSGGRAATADGQWPMAAKNWQNTRFSGLAQINRSNAGQLKLAWTFATGVKKGQEAAPIVVGTTMYVVTPYPNILYALDLTKAGTPAVLKWKYIPKTIPAAQGVACCDVVNRGAVYSDGKVIINTLDGQTIAVDAASGREVWKTRVADIQIGETVTMSPLVARGKVFVGNSGGEMGVRGWIKALDVSTGRLLWTAYSTGPDADVKIGPRFRAFYPSERGKDLGVQTWPPGGWKIGGGNVWGWVSYDPELNLIYHGTGNPGVWNPELRPGDNKWTCGVFARDPDTGEARWFYQWSPHDLFDHDGINENLVLDLPIGGATRKVLLTAQRTGYVYLLDRATGQVLSATPFVRVTAYKGVDLKSGRMRPNQEKEPHTGEVVRDIAPASPGGKDWQPTAYSPRTGLFYIPHQTLSMDYEGVDANYIEGTPYVGVNEKMYPDPVRPGDGSRGEFTAWDPIRARPVWEIKERFPCWSGTVVTGGDVAFYGTMDGWFKAVDARTGKLLWRFKTESGVIGQPVTYIGPDGKQYVAVISGVGGWAGAIVSAQIDPRDRGAALGFVNAMTDLPKASPPGDKLYVFALP